MMISEMSHTDESNVFFLFYLINKQMYIVIGRHNGCLTASAKCGDTE